MINKKITPYALLLPPIFIVAIAIWFLMGNVFAADRIINADKIQSNTGAGSICVPSATTLDCSEVSYLDGVTSAIQTQLNGKQATGNYVTGLTGDVSAAGPGSVAATVNSVGGSTAASVNTAAVAVFNATAAASSNTLCLRDGFASSAFGAVTATNLTGNLTTTSTIDTTAVTTVVAGAQAANAATASATSNTIAKRDGFGGLVATGFSGGDLNGNITGTANNVTGVVAIANGGSGQSNQQAGINNLTDITSHSNGDVFQLLTGNAQFAPLSIPALSGTANNLTYYDASGNLTGVPYWFFNPDYFGLFYTYTGPAITAGAQGLVTAIQADVSGGDKFLHNMYSNGHATGNYYGLNLNSDDVVDGNSSLINVSNTNTIGGNFVFSNAYNSTLGTIAGDYRGGQWGNDATIANNGAGLLVTQNGAVTKSWTGYGATVNADVGDGTGNNIIGFDSSFTSGTINGNMYGLNFNNSSNITGTNNILGVNVNNQGTGYRFSGMSVYNNQNMTEETRGFQFNNQGDMRTGTGLDISMQGNATDDVQGIRVNMTNQTSSSATSHVHSLDLSGGLMSVQSSFVPFNSTGVDIGNGISVLTEIPNGSPVTGTDVIQTLIQSNLLLHDTINAGPFGLGVNAIGAVGQVAFDSGVTIPTYRSMLLGTSVPSGSGGTITDWIGLEMIGLSSFGGSIINTNRIGIQDSNLVGQNFCDSATNCWFLRVRDTNAETSLQKLAIGTATEKVSAGVKLEINDGHIKSTQTSAPVATPNANAGTSATCSVTGTDHSGSIQLVTGSASWVAGAQCDVAFNVAYGSSPKCTISPTNDNGALASMNTYISKSTTALTLNFVNADVAATTYGWDYNCVETN